MPSHSTGCFSRLLMVDDDLALLEALSGTLETRFGHLNVDICDSGLKAMDLVRSHNYDTIIADVNMPNMNGFEFLTAVKQVQPETPVLMITGHADRTMMLKAFEEGAADFIPKPFDREDLVQAVRHGLELSRLQSGVVKLRQDLQQQALRRLTNGN
jgi:DNA-binding NtrC family response regulator